MGGWAGAPEVQAGLDSLPRWLIGLFVLVLVAAAVFIVAEHFGGRRK